MTQTINHYNHMHISKLFLCSCDATEFHVAYTMTKLPIGNCFSNITLRSYDPELDEFSCWKHGNNGEPEKFNSFAMKRKILFVFRQHYINYIEVLQKDAHDNEKTIKDLQLVVFKLQTDKFQNAVLEQLKLILADSIRV